MQGFRWGIDYGASYICVGIFERSYFLKISGLVTIVFGVISFIGISLLINTTMSDAGQAFEQGMLLFKIVQVESMDVRLARYASQFFQDSVLSLSAFAFPLLASVLYAMTRRIIFATAGLAVLVVTLLCGGYLCGGWNNDGSFAPPVAVFAMLIMSMLVSIPVWSRNRSFFVLFSVLILLPYSVAMGTSNTLFTQIVVSLAPWGTLVAVLVVADQPKGFSKMPVSLIGLCFIVTVSLQIVTSGLRPYHLSNSLLKQNKAIIIGNLGVVKVDAETYNFLMVSQSRLQSWPHRARSAFPWSI